MRNFLFSFFDFKEPTGLGWEVLWRGSASRVDECADQACCYSCAVAHRSEAGPQSIRPGRKASFMTSRYQECYFCQPISSVFFESRISFPMKPEWMTEQFIRMWPRALFHMKQGRKYLDVHLKKPGVYVLYRDDQPYYIGKTGKSLVRRLSQHGLRPDARRYNFWNYFSAFLISDPDQRDEVEAILIAAMPTANSSRPKFQRKKIDRQIAKLLNDIQSRMLTGTEDRSATVPEELEEDE
jgi:hypothetical protein